MKNSEDLFKSIYSATLDELGKYVYFRVNNIDDAQDIVQTVYLDYYQHVYKKGKNIENVLAYLKQMAHNQLITYYKDKQYRVEQLDWLDEALENQVSSVNVELEVFEKFESERLWGAVTQLNDLQQKIIIGKFRFAMTFKEIAEQLSVNENTIKTTYYRSLEQLKELLEK